MICLSLDEVREITGLKKASAQLRWFRQQGFIVRQRADGMPLVSRNHFQQMMGGMLSQKISTEQEPDFGALL